MRTVVIGCGNVLASDDAIGLEVIARLKKQELPPDVEVIEGGTPGLSVLDWIEGYDKAILVDAIQSGAPPGSVHRVPLSQLTQGPLPLSAHDMNLVDALALGYRAMPERMPKAIVVIGVEIATEDKFKVGLSPQVQAAIPEAIEAVLREIDMGDESALP